MPAPKIGQKRNPIGTFMEIEENVNENVNVSLNNDVKVNNDVNKDVNDNVKVDNDVYVYVKKKKFEDRYTRQTVYIENDIAKKIDKFAGKEKGLKTTIYNDALREFILKNKI